MYLWRRLTEEQRKQLLSERQQNFLPWHGPPHYAADSATYLVTAACYEHRHAIGHTTKRMEEFEKALINACESAHSVVCAWTILPNHYHVLLKAPAVDALLRILGQLHGRTSYAWNNEESALGRKVWHRAAETGIKSERHFWASLLYVLNNAVRHGYVEKWQDWPYSSAGQWLDQVGHDRAVAIWREYPIDCYGDEWDPPGF